MSERDEFALKIGTHILDSYEQWLKKPMGRTVKIPFQLPHHSGQPEWCANVEMDCPWFIESYFEKGEYKTKHWTLNEYMGWKP